MALLRIKEEPKDDENEPGFSRSLLGFAQRSAINAVGIAELQHRNRLNLEHAQVTQQRRENIRKRCVRSNASSSGVVRASSIDDGEDTCVNSDEERSRRASEIKYNKELDRQAKRARRRTNPPDDWKETLDVMRPDNVILSADDFKRKRESSLDAKCDNDVDAMDESDNSYSTDIVAPSITVKKNKVHIGYPSDVPLVAQQLYLPLEPVISNEVREVLTQIDTKKTDEKPVLAFDDARGPVNVPMTSYHLATNLTKTNIANGVTVPTSYDITLRSSEMNDLMLCSRTDDQGRLFSEKFLQDVMCRPEDQNFIYNKLRKTTLYNCPLSRVGSIDDYLAYMTTHTRKVNEQMSRACYPHERPCIEDLRCIGRRIPLSEPITLVEYFNMDDIENLRKTGVWSKPRRHCILCKWDQATKTAFNVLAECAAYSDKMVRMRMLSDSNYDPQRRALMLVDYCDVVGEKEYSPYDVMVSNLNRGMGHTSLKGVIIDEVRVPNTRETAIIDDEQQVLSPSAATTSDPESDVKLLCPVKDPLVVPPPTANDPNAALLEPLYEASISCVRKKKADCVRLGPFFCNDAESRRKRELYRFRYDSPFVCPQTLRLLHPNVPHVVFARNVRSEGLTLKIPLWAHSQIPQHRAEAVRQYAMQNYSIDEQRAVFARWAPNYTLGTLYDDDFICSVYRMEWLENFQTSLHVPESDGRLLSREAYVQVSLLQDMNQMRLLLMDTRKLYTRAGCIDAVGEDAYMGIYGTTLANVMHCGLIPDLACIHANLTYWDKPTETFARMSIPFEHDVVAWTLIRMFNKVIFQPSKMRELNKCIRDEITRMEERRHIEVERIIRYNAKPDENGNLPTPLPFPTHDAIRFMMILVRLIFCSLAGFYPHSTQTAPTFARRELYRRYVFDVPSLKEFKIWVMHNKRLMTMILRENHIYNLGIMPGIESVFRNLYEYDKIRNKTLHAIETVRNTFVANLVVLEGRIRNDICPLELRPRMMHKVYKSHFLLECAMLSNVGEMLWAFSNRYGGEFTDPELQSCLATIFWECTSFHKVDNILCSFKIGISSNFAETYLRTIVLYWLILRDRCVDQSGKKTREKYNQCKNTLNDASRFLLPKLPLRKKSLNANAVGKRKKRFTDMRDNVLIVETTNAEREIVASFQCPRHCATQLSCNCIVDMITACVASFDIYRLLQPIAWCERTVPVDRGIEQYLWSMYDACLGWCYRPRQTSFAEEITISATSVCNIFGSVASLKTELKCTKVEAQRLFDRFHHTHKLYKEIRAEIREKIESVVHALPPDAGVGIDWLINNFKVSINPVIDIDDAFIMMMEESNHHHPHNAMMRIARVYPRDFWIIRLLFKIRHRRESIRLYPLWAEITKQQIQALHAQYNVVHQNEALPESIGCIYYCPYHKRILSPIVGADVPKRGFVNTRAVGIENIAVDPLTNTKYCYIRTGRIDRRCVVETTPDEDDAPDDDVETTISNMPRSLRRLFAPEEDAYKLRDDDSDANSDNEYNNEDKDDEDEKTNDEILIDTVVSDDDADIHSDHSDEECEADLKVSDAKKSQTLVGKKRRTKKSKYGRCTREPAKVVNMVGKLFMLFKKLYLLCPYCGHVMHYGRDKCTEIGLWCGACTRGEKALATKLGITWDATNQCADPKHIRETIAGVQVWKKKYPVCLFCGRGPTGLKFLKYHLVYNDLFMDRAIGMCYVSFCDSHSSWWIGSAVETIRLSTIFFNLRAVSDATQTKGDVWKIMPRSIPGDQGERSTPIFGILFGDILQQEPLTENLVGKYKARERTKKIKRKRALSHSRPQLKQTRKTGTVLGRKKDKGKAKMSDIDEITALLAQAHKEQCE